MKKITTIIISSIIAFIGIFAPLTTPTAYAIEDICSMESVSDEIKRASGCSQNDNDIKVNAINIINVVIGLLSIIAVIAIIIGGIQYMTSAGDSGKIKRAKDIILYAVIGLIICALSTAIVNFAVNTINGSDGSGSTTSQDNT